MQREKRKKGMDARRCEFCNSVYRPKVWWQKYCNNNGVCRLRAFRKRLAPVTTDVLAELERLKEENIKIKKKLGIK